MRRWRASAPSSSLLLGFRHRAVQTRFVEGPLRASASNKPSTRPLAEGLPHRRHGMTRRWSLGDVHWGLVIEPVRAVRRAWLALTAPEASRCAWWAAMRAPRSCGPAHRPTHPAACLLGGAAPGWPVRWGGGRAPPPTSVIAGLGSATGILVSFVAQLQPWAIPPVALLLVAFAAASNLLQQRLGPPDNLGAGAAGFAFVASSWPPRRCAGNCSACWSSAAAAARAVMPDTPLRRTGNSASMPRAASRQGLART